MTEWGVVGVVIALTGLLATLAKPMLTLNGTITRLTAKLEDVGAQLGALSAANSRCHERMWQKMSELERLLGEHGRQIAVMRHPLVSGGIERS